MGRITVVQKGDIVKLRNTDIENGRTILEKKVESFKFDNEFDGYIFFQYRGRDEGVSYSAGQYTETYVKADQDEVELARNNAS